MGRTAPTYAEFVAAFPAFATVDTTVVQNQLDDSANLLSVSVWDVWYGRAVSLDAAHNLALSQVLGSNSQTAVQSAGTITSASAAGVSTGFSQPQWSAKSTSTNWYIRTVYGQQFLRLRNTVVPPVEVSFV